MYGLGGVWERAEVRPNRKSVKSKNRYKNTNPNKSNYWIG